MRVRLACERVHADTHYSELWSLIDTLPATWPLVVELVHGDCSQAGVHAACGITCCSSVFTFINFSSQHCDKTDNIWLPCIRFSAARVVACTFLAYGSLVCLSALPVVHSQGAHKCGVWCCLCLQPTMLHVTQYPLCCC